MTNRNFFNLQKNFGAIIVLAVIAVVSCNGFVQTAKTSNFGLDLKGLNVRGGQTKLALSADIPELRPPKSMYANVVELGAMKASMSPLKTFILGILSGCHIAFGKWNYLSPFLSSLESNSYHIFTHRRFLSTHCWRCVSRHSRIQPWSSENHIGSIRSSIR